MDADLLQIFYDFFMLNIINLDIKEVLTRLNANNVLKYSMRKVSEELHSYFRPTSPLSTLISVI